MLLVGPPECEHPHRALDHRVCRLSRPRPRCRREERPRRKVNERQSIRCCHSRDLEDARLKLIEREQRAGVGMDRYHVLAARDRSRQTEGINRRHRRVGTSSIGEDEPAARCQRACVEARTCQSLGKRALPGLLRERLPIERQACVDIRQGCRRLVVHHNFMHCVVGPIRHGQGEHRILPGLERSRR